MEKDMMKELKETALEAAEIMASTPLGYPGRKEEVKRLATGLESTMILYCIHAQTDVKFKKDINKYLLDLADKQK